MSRPSDPAGFGEALRAWRERRRLSQLELSSRAGISARHLSFVETGRSRPSREMVLRLVEDLEIPLREQNELLLAAGFAPTFPERPLTDPNLLVIRETVALILAGHEPSPALALDRHWNVVSANRAVAFLLEGVSPHLLEPPINVLRLSLHHQGLAPRIVNLFQWREHLLEQVARQLRQTTDAALAALEEEVRSYPVSSAPNGSEDPDYAGIAVPLRLSTPDGVMSFISTTTVFGTATDVTVSELVLETFFPADAHTAQALKRAYDRGSSMTGKHDEGGA